MPSRYRSSLDRRVVDIDAARRAVAQVAQERDAVAQQLSRTQSALASAQRQLQARRDEAAHLHAAVSSLRAQERDRPPAEHNPGLSDALADCERWQGQAQAAEAQLQQLRRSTAEAVAERDAERASRRRVQAELQALRQAEPAADQSQRLAADLANLRRHSEDRIERGIQAETARLLIELVSIHDTVQRALAQVPDRNGPWHDGLMAIASKLTQVLQREGATLVGEIGERFDPIQHQAVATAPGEPAGVVIDVVARGLALADGTIRAPAQVVVGADEEST